MAHLHYLLCGALIHPSFQPTWHLLPDHHWTRLAHILVRKRELLQEMPGIQRVGAFSPQDRTFQGKKKHININKFAGLSRDWVGAKILFMCVFGSFPMREKNT